MRFAYTHKLSTYLAAGAAYFGLAFSGELGFVVLLLIFAGMSRLNDRYRRAIEMRLLDERSRDECAAELAITVGNFDVLFHRAVRAFRKHFGERE